MHIFGWILSLVTLTSQRSIGPVRQRDDGSASESAWDAALSRATALVAQLNITEKINMATGGFEHGSCIGNIASVERLGFRGLCMQDGPSGVGRADLVSVFPAGLTVAATWDRDLIYQRGLAIGAEFREKGANVMLGPTTGPMGRHPLGGRNWEGFGPDPYLAGIGMAETIRGVQEVGVQTCSKHYIGNEQETQRSITSVNGSVVEAISSNIDDRTLHELYLWPFAEAVKAGTTSLMCSYNRVNGTYACENSVLLNAILKEELGFRGYVVSDWFATHSTATSANSGLDLEMPGGMPNTGIEGPAAGPFYGGVLLAAVSNGTVTEQRLDDMATRVLTPYFLLNQDISFPTVDPSGAGVFAAEQYGLPRLNEIPGAGSLLGGEINIVEGRDVRGDHATIIRKIGAAGTVLLKNLNSALPLQNPKYVAVFGNDAAPLIDDHPSHSSEGYDIGTLYGGGGSGAIRAENPVAPLDAIKERSRQDGFRVKTIANNTILAQGEFQAVFPWPDVCLVFLKSYASEGRDRPSIELDYNSTAVVNSVASWCNNTVVVTHSGGVNTLPFARHENVTAILAAHYPGDQSGHSIVDVLWGDYAPSGRLPYTIPETEDDYGFPIFNSSTNDADPRGWQADFTEGQLIDYKKFDAKNITPLYEFGFGLSYTTFDLTGSLAFDVVQEKISATPDPTRSIQIGGHPDLWEDVVQVSITISNIGTRAGKAVPQLYISFPPSGVPEGTPVKSLRGFESVLLEPAQTQTVTFRLKRRDVSYWDVITQNWTIPLGEFTFYAGFSSRDLKAQ
ncbi:beta-glucosidase, partial [Corynespora cassiicola Philippines]